MGELSEQLKKYMAEASPEQLKKDFFNAECRSRGIDPTLPNAKRFLKRMKRKERWDIRWPYVSLGLNAFCCIIFFTCLGAAIVDRAWTWCVFDIVWGLYFMLKVILNAREIW